MRHAAPVRRELGTRTIFNVLGPLTNPAGARAGVFGVYSAEVARTVADALAVLDARRAFVVHGAHGIDELSPAGPNLVFEVADGERARARDRPGRARDRRRATRTSSPVARPRRTRARRARFSRARRARSATPSSLNAAGAIAAAGHAADLARRARSRGRGDRQRSRGGTAGGARRVLATIRLMGRFEDALRRPGLTAIAEVKRRSPSAGDLRPGRRSGGARRCVRAGGRCRGLDPRRRALRRHLGRPARRARVRDAPAPREGLLLDGGAPAHRARSGCRCRAAPAARPRRRDRSAAPGSRRGARPRRRSSRRTTPRSSSARSRSTRR